MIKGFETIAGTPNFPKPMFWGMAVFSASREGVVYLFPQEGRFPKLGEEAAFLDLWGNSFGPLDSYSAARKEECCHNTQSSLPGMDVQKMIVKSLTSLLK